MYESFFELSQRPFVPNPLTSRYYAASAIEAARGTLVRCIQRAEGTGLVVGAAGTGKTMLCYLLADLFRDSLAVAMLFSGHLASRQDLLRAILFELRQPYRGMDEGELRLSLIDYLTRSEECSQGLLLLIDEAHALPLRLLEEIRMITNLTRGGQPQVRLVLAGGPALEEHFASPKLEYFAQRLAARCYLEPFDRQETFDYVRSQLRAVGAEPSTIFSDAALEAVYRATDGIPRLINQVCDHALVLAQAQQVRRLEAHQVEAAWADLQQLPAPWSEQTPAGNVAAKPTVVEFGDLDDEFFAPGPELRLALPPSELHDDEFVAEPGTSHCQSFESISVSEEHSGQFDEPWGLLESDFLGIEQNGLPEVELIFDEALADEEQPQSDPLVAISYTKPDCEHDTNPSVPAMEADEPLLVELPTQWAVEPFQAAKAQTVPSFTSGVLPQQGAPVSQNELPEEEVVVDRYAVLDALKDKGILDRHALPPMPVATHRPASPFYSSSYSDQPASPGDRWPALPPAARPNIAAEKNLTLAEALVRHATLVEQTSVEPPQMPESMFSVLSMPAPADAAPTDAWTPLARESLDTLAASSAYAAQQASASASPLAGDAGRSAEERRTSAAHVVALDGPARGAALVDNPRAGQRAEQHELALIVVEDDPQSVVIPTPPQVTPVRRQEYRQLFARLRKS